MKPESLEASLKAVRLGKCNGDGAITGPHKSGASHSMVGTLQLAAGPLHLNSRRMLKTNKNQSRTTDIFKEVGTCYLLVSKTLRSVVDTSVTATNLL